MLQDATRRDPLGRGGIQRDVAEMVRARVFSWSETILQGFWVLGGTIGILVPLEPRLGFSVIFVVVLAAGAVALRSRSTGPHPLVALVQFRSDA